MLSSQYSTLLFAIIVHLCRADGFYPPFHCTGSVSDKERDDALQFIEGARFALVSGGSTKDKNGKFLPEPENMYRLLWDCKLEKRAQDAVDTCAKPQANAQYGMNFIENRNFTTIEEIIFPWFIEVQNVVWPKGNVYDGDDAYKNYANMVQARTTGVGCAKKTCSSGKQNVVCYFNQPDVKVGEKIYVTGKKCVKDADCTTYDGSVCDINNECVAPQKNNRICPENTDMNDRIRERALKMHNWRRTQLAQGKVQKNNLNYLPSAGNMNKLKYDCELEFQAKLYADKCLATESDPNTRLDVGENVYQVSEDDTVPYRVNATEASIKYWWSQVRKVEGIGIDQVTFKQHHLNSTIRFFTMMGWAETEYLGCGVTKCSSKFTVVCRYKIGGNTVGQVVYKKGPVCKQCPVNTSCTETEALCVKK